MSKQIIKNGDTFSMAAIVYWSDRNGWETESEKSFRELREDWQRQMPDVIEGRLK